MEGLRNEGPFDLLLTDTSLFQAIISAIKCGKGERVLQIDPDEFYGGPQAGSHKINLNNPENSNNPKTAKLSFIYDPSPIVFYARGPLSELLLRLELTEYIDFMAVDAQYIWPSQQVLIPLPLSKEQVMLEPSLTLMEKRKLSKMLNLAADFDPADRSQRLENMLNRENIFPESRVFQLIVYAACRCSSHADFMNLSIETAAKIIESLRTSIRHLEGRQSPFVLPIWGSSEISQAACRKAAVSGCTQVFNTSTHQISEAGIEYYSSTSQTLLEASQRRKALLLSKPILGLHQTVLITVPPACDLNPNPDAAAINIFQLTSDSKCCPPGTWLVYIWTTDDCSGFDAIESVLCSDDQILWSKDVVIERLPFYQIGAISAPFQPLLPASYQAESTFVQAIDAINQ